MEKIYDVYEAIWIAAAAYAFQQHEWKYDDNISAVYLKCAELVEMAKNYTKKRLIIQEYISTAMEIIRATVTDILEDFRTVRRYFV